MLTACNGNGSTSGNKPSGDSTAQATEQPATELPEEEIEEIEITVMKGPGTIECKNFTIDVPQDWEGQYVQDPRSIKLSVKAPSPGREDVWQQHLCHLPGETRCSRHLHRYHEDWRRQLWHYQGQRLQRQYRRQQNDTCHSRQREDEITTTVIT